MEKFRYLIFNKPYGVLSNFVDLEGRPTLKKFIPVQDVYAAGRLDFDSEGLLLLTDDGKLIKSLTDPVSHQAKTYLVQVEGLPTADQLAKLEQGVMLKGKKTRRAKVLQIPEPEIPTREKPVTPHGPTTWLRMVLWEGKKRQIRHMTAAVGLPTLRILRIAIGNITLGNLRPGEWRELTSLEVDLLKSSR
jgi:23S rRNA pseudouridine2457 synthase